MNSKNILVSGLVNTETTVQVRQFPIPYYPIDYPFFGVNTAVSGVGYNLSKALRTLGDQVTLLSMTGQDFPAAYIRQELQRLDIATDHLRNNLRQTPSSVVLYDGDGRRQIYCDLKDIQEASYGFSEEMCRGFDLVAACNINFNRPLLPIAKSAGIPIATDVHVLTNIWDNYNREFIDYADILFLSDEGIGDDFHPFLWELAHSCGAGIIVLGRGSKGAAMYLRDDDRIHMLPAASVGPVINTVGAGDALFSAFLHYHSHGFAPLEALSRAQLFAAAKIRVSGASNGFLSASEMDALYRTL